MKKTFKILLAFMAMVAMLAMTVTAHAVELPGEKIAITAQPVDYVSAKAGIAQPVIKSYVANERYALLVSVTVPSYLDTTAMALEVKPKSCTVDDMGALALVTGDYLMYGTVLASGATVKITAKDTAIDTASTANELFAAIYGDRTVSATATLGAATTASQTVSIPKTGGQASIAGAALCLLLAAALVWRKKHA